MSKKPPHALTTELVRDALAALLPTDWHVSSQEPVTTLDSEPEPDVIVVRGKRRQFANRHPQPEELALVVEVADASRPRDQGIKKRLYARANIGVYWIVNLIAMQIEVYTVPTSQAQLPDYVEQTIYKPGEEVPVLLDGVEIGRIAVQDLLP
jgi:Uma2 family endonuclease